MLAGVLTEWSIAVYTHLAPSAEKPLHSNTQNDFIRMHATNAQEQKPTPEIMPRITRNRIYAKRVKKCY